MIYYRVVKLVDGAKEYWDGSESPYSQGSEAWTSVISAYSESDITRLQRKVNKKKRQLRKGYNPLTILTPYTISKLTTFNGAYIEGYIMQPVGEHELDESV